jgi:curved DNA-binding protein CbpA
MSTRFEQYLSALKTDFTKIARLEFLNPNGTIAFVLDNNYKNNRSGAFIQSGTLSVNLQNGTRRTASVTLSNTNGEYDFNVNNLWFGTMVRLQMGLLLPDGSEYLVPQGVFYIKDPEEQFMPNQRTITLTLVDKWSMLDGTLGGNLDGIYEVPVNSNIFEAIDGLLKDAQGNGYVFDNTPAVYTSYYNNMTQTLPDGSTASLVESPYTARFDSFGESYADVILELNSMVAGWIGYDASGALRLEPSQDDILDISKPILWTFSPSEKQFLGATYSIKSSEVKNEIIRVGQALDDGYAQVGAKAQNFDPSSDTNINIIGRKVDRKEQSNYYTNDICASLAEFELKRNTILKKSVTIRSTQMFHLVENNLVVIRRIDKEGKPFERHLINGFTIPIGQTGEMTINATSVSDFPIATVTYLTTNTANEQE